MRVLTCANVCLLARSLRTACVSLSLAMVFAPIRAAGMVAKLPVSAKFSTALAISVFTCDVDNPPPPAAMASRTACVSLSLPTVFAPSRVAGMVAALATSAKFSTAPAISEFTCSVDNPPPPPPPAEMASRTSWASFTSVITPSPNRANGIVAVLPASA